MRKFVYATFWQRLVALFIDYAIIFVVYLILLKLVPQQALVTILTPLKTIILATPTTTTVTLPIFKFFKIYLLIQILLTITNYAYSVYLTAHFGQTVGKMLIHIKVVSIRPHAKKITCSQAFIRETVGKLASGFFVGIGFLWFFTNKKRQTWHDRLAQTVVISEKL